MILYPHNEYNIKDPLLNTNPNRLKDHFVKFMTSRMKRYSNITVEELEELYIKLMTYNSKRRAKQKVVLEFKSYIEWIEDKDYSYLKRCCEYIIRNLSNRSTLIENSKLSNDIKKDNKKLVLLTNHSVRCVMFLKNNPDISLTNKIKFVIRKHKHFIENNNVRTIPLELINESLFITTGVIKSIK